MERWFHRIEIILISVVFMVLSSGCQSSIAAIPSTTEQYPADIRGYVTVTESLSEQGSVYNPPDSYAFWVVDITFSNKSYDLPDISSYDHWNIVAGDKYYWIPDLLRGDKLPLLQVPVGQIEKKVVCFQVPDSLKLSQARLYYQAQKIVAFGPLTGGDKVKEYDWGLKKVARK